MLAQNRTNLLGHQIGNYELEELLTSRDASDLYLGRDGAWIADLRAGDDDSGTKLSTEVEHDWVSLEWIHSGRTGDCDV